jgi:hypothetical protein
MAGRKMLTLMFSDGRGHKILTNPIPSASVEENASRTWTIGLSHDNNLSSRF